MKQMYVEARFVYSLVVITDTFNRANTHSFLHQGITFDEFRSFFQFLNNLEDFTIAMQMYNFASRSIGQGKYS